MLIVAYIIGCFVAVLAFLTIPASHIDCTTMVSTVGVVFTLFVWSTLSKNSLLYKRLRKIRAISSWLFVSWFLTYIDPMSVLSKRLFLFFSVWVVITHILLLTNINLIESNEDSNNE